MDNLGFCFVIQPFDGGKFDKRFDDVFEPAIEAADLDAYRVDRDPHAAIPIAQIEEGIRRSAICFADITTDNPNVWFELGFAIASGKDVVIVCADSRTTPFPFDIQHRAIIKYKTDSSSDFHDLGSRITERLKAFLEKQVEIGRAAEPSPIKDTEGLSPHEIVGLVTVAQNTDSDQDWISAGTIRQDMRRAGYTDIAVTLAMRALIEKQMIDHRMDSDYNGNEFVVYSVTAPGIRWLQSNQDRLVLRQKPSQAKQPTSPFDLDDDDLPF